MTTEKDRQEINEAFSRVPVNRHLGFRLVSHSPEEAVLEMEVRTNLMQETGVVHGGRVSALADTAAVYTLHPYLSDDQSMASIEFKMNFLRPVSVDRGPLVARSKALRRGRKVGVCEVELTQDNVLVAKGLFTYLFFEKTEWKRKASNLKNSGAE